MKWMGGKRKPEVIYTAGTNTYLGKDNAEIRDAYLGKMFKIKDDWLQPP